MARRGGEHGGLQVRIVAVRQSDLCQSTACARVAPFAECEGQLVSDPGVRITNGPQKRAGEAKNGVDIGYVIPKEGAQLWFDNLAIPRDARHPAEAHALIDFLLRPEIAAKNTNLIAYANGVAASRPFVDREILQDRGIYPDAATMQHLYTITAHDQKTQRLINRLWTRIKTGI